MPVKDAYVIKIIHAESAFHSEPFEKICFKIDRNCKRLLNIYCYIYMIVLMIPTTC